MTTLTEFDVTEIVGNAIEIRGAQAAREERRRCVGILLRAIGEYRLAKRVEVAAALERLATEMEHPEGER